MVPNREEGGSRERVVFERHTRVMEFGKHRRATFRAVLEMNWSCCVWALLHKDATPAPHKKESDAHAQ